MNALLGQFVAEARGLIETASKALLDLEQNSKDKAQIDQLFRAVHTIKGAAGLFDFTPLTKTVHAGEDLLDKIRSGERPFTSEVVDLLLEMLDRCVEWLDQVEKNGRLNDDAAEAGDALSARIRSLMDSSGTNPEEKGNATNKALAAPWPSYIPELAVTGPVTHIRYTPAESAFFAGDDPLRTVQTAPGLIWSRIRVPEHWPVEEEIDPFLVAVSFDLISTASQADLEEHFTYILDEVQFETVARSETPRIAPIDASLADAIKGLLASQSQLLRTNHSEPTDANTRASITEVLQRVARKIKIQLPQPDDEPEISRSTLETWVDVLVREVNQPPAEAHPQHIIDDSTASSEPPRSNAGAPTRPNSHLRVSSERIDGLMNLIGELIVAKNALPFLAQKAEAMEEAAGLVRDIKSQHNTINRISEELQAAIMQIRMVPMSTILSRFNRLVRDMSRKLGKEIQYEVEGDETEADKAIVDELAEPIVHLIRNSIDHGLEDPATREAVGKSRSGTIRVRTYQHEESVVLEVIDDGRGIDVDSVTTKAVRQGFIEQDKVDALSHAEALQLIFLPGLSTKETVSDLSGRGVGMDAVASMVRRLGGTIAISSERGQGTKVTLKLPLSMAVQRLMMVEVGDGLYGVPIDRVVESQKIKPAHIRHHRDAEMVLLRDRLVPLIRMRTLFGCPSVEENSDLSVMVVDVDGQESGLIVDKFHPSVDAIIKPMTGVLTPYSCYSGTALLGDGSILLALNLREVVECQYH